MSRKSRQKSRKSRSKSRSGSGGAADGGRSDGTVAGTLDPAESAGDEDELIHAPREVSKLRFVLMIGLVVVLLIIFIVPTAIMGIAGSDDENDPIVFRWEHPADGPQEYRYTALRFEMQAFDFAFEVDPLIKLQLGIFDRRPSEEQVGRLLVLDRLALDSGVGITTQDLGQHLRMLLNLSYQGSSDLYKQRASMYPGGIPAVEGALGRLLRIARFLELAGHAGAVPDPSEIESFWEAEHVEQALDYVVLEIAQFQDAARDELPSDDELSTWFDDLPDAERDELRSPERRRAQVVRYTSATDTPAAGLVAAFPEAADANADDRAQEYYNRVFYKRFVEPQEPQDDDADESGATTTQEFRSFDDVRERCLAEAPIYFALQAWLTDLQTRHNAGEEIDLVAEAAGHGLELIELPAPISRADLAEHPDFTEDMLVGTVFQTTPESFGYAVVAGESELAIVRVLERTERTLPPFEELRDDVAELWIEPRAAELAHERLRALWESFEEFTPETPEDEVDLGLPPDDRTHRRALAETFPTAAEEAGLSVARRDWLDRGGEADADPDFEDPAHQYLWNARFAMDLEEGEVAEPDEAPDGDVLYLVRLAGEREVPLERMSPAEYRGYKARARGAAAGTLSEGYDVAFLEERYGFAFLNEEPEEPEALDTPAPEASESEAGAED